MFDTVERVVHRAFSMEDLLRVSASVSTIPAVLIIAVSSDCDMAVNVCLMIARRDLDTSSFPAMAGSITDRS